MVISYWSFIKFSMVLIVLIYVLPSLVFSQLTEKNWSFIDSLYFWLEFLILILVYLIKNFIYYKATFLFQLLDLVSIIFKIGLNIFIERKIN